MTFTITIGWWIIPLLLTLLFFWRIGVMMRSDVDTPTGYGKAGQAACHALLLSAAIILSLVVWLIYAFII